MYETNISACIAAEKRIIIPPMALNFYFPPRTRFEITSMKKHAR